MIELPPEHYLVRGAAGLAAAAILWVLAALRFRAAKNRDRPFDSGVD